MRHVRYNEPRDPDLFGISKVVPDRWLDEQWPQQSHAGWQGPWRRLTTSQLVRIHLLALVKNLRSFNRTCRELRHNLDFRRFCRLRGSDTAPTPCMLASFRSWFGVRGWRRFHVCVLRSLAQIHEPAFAGVALVDGSDIPAAIRRTAKKKTGRRSKNDASRRGLAKGRDRRRADNPSSSRATRNTPCVC
jgi:hypothetical protein